MLGEQSAREGVDLDTALAESTHPTNHRYSVLALVELERVDSERLPVLIHVADELPDPLVSSIDDALELGPERLPLAILGGESEQPIDITRVERGIGSTDDLDVLLRHRLFRQPHGTCPVVCSISRPEPAPLPAMRTSATTVSPWSIVVTTQACQSGKTPKTWSM